MPLDNWIIKITESDFNVEFVASNGDSALFAALRKGGTEIVPTNQGCWRTHTMGVWHFVVATNQERDNTNNVQTQQWHIPRYQMAAGLRQQDHFFKSESYPEPVCATWMPFQTRVYGRNKLAFCLPGTGEFLLPESFVRKMKKDLPLLEAAIDRVKCRDNKTYHLPKAKTAASHPIESECEEIIRAIAFEKLTRPRMKAGNFGIYSAYCTYRDFALSVKMPEATIRQLVEGQFDYKPDEIGDGIHELFLQTQKRLLRRPIWGRGIRMTIDAAVSTLAQGMEKLTRTQRTQFILMNGMHGAGLFLPLATILGLCSFSHYAHHMCSAWQSDSPQEQDRRKEIAYIELFGKLENLPE